MPNLGLEPTANSWPRLNPHRYAGNNTSLSESGPRSGAGYCRASGLCPEKTVGVLETGALQVHIDAGRSGAAGLYWRSSGPGVLRMLPHLASRSA